MKRATVTFCRGRRMGDARHQDGYLLQWDGQELFYRASGGHMGLVSQELVNRMVRLSEKGYRIVSGEQPPEG